MRFTREIMKWINVQDKLPKDFDVCEYDWVLVFGESDGMYLTGFAQRDGDKWEIYDDMGVHSDTGAYDLKSEDITHWSRIELPEDR